MPQTPRPIPVPLRARPQRGVWIMIKGLAGMAGFTLLAACDDTIRTPEKPLLSAAQITILIQHASANKEDPQGWGEDLHSVLKRLNKPTTQENACAVIAVAEQVSNMHADPKVPGLPAMVKQRFAQIDNPLLKRALELRLRFPALNGRTFEQNLQQLQTEQDLEGWYAEFTAAQLTAPILKMAGKDIDSLISTIGSMQVSAQFARDFAQTNGLSHVNIRKDLYTRYWGLYYGSAHLLAYEVPYTSWLYRFADYNAGHYTSRNAGFQHMVRVLSGAKVQLDGDLLAYDEPAAKDAKAQMAAARRSTLNGVLRALKNNNLNLDESTILADLERGKSADFVNTDTYRTIAGIYERKFKTVVTEKLPSIELKSQKIQRRLTTAWFANRVMARFEDCRRISIQP